MHSHAGAKEGGVREPARQVDCFFQQQGSVTSAYDIKAVTLLPLRDLFHFLSWCLGLFVLLKCFTLVSQKVSRYVGINGAVSLIL